MQASKQAVRDTLVKIMKESIERDALNLSLLEGVNEVKFDKADKSAIHVICRTNDGPRYFSIKLTETH